MILNGDFNDLFGFIYLEKYMILFGNNRYYELYI